MNLTLEELKIINDALFRRVIELKSDIKLYDNLSLKKEVEDELEKMCSLKMKVEKSTFEFKL